MEQGIIRILSDDVIGKIAAGEVVERPASVVKELIENAIDARAGKIEIEIKDGGQKLIEVTDDGIGMHQQDAVLAFSPHATSKINTEQDLDDLNTLGFRGEALATIAAVSRVTLLTRTEGSGFGTRVNVEGSRIVGVETDSFPRGTRLQVKNLFYNVPARRKFLKSIQVEMAQISDIVCHYILGYPELAFRFTKNNILLASSMGTGELIDSVLTIYGPEVAKSLIPLKEPPALAGSGISVRGFISKPNDARPSSRYMTTLINRRFVKSKLVSQAIGKALSAFFPKGRYPVLVFDLRVPNEMVDVNVHPQKTEVRFKDERWIFGVVLETIQTTLSGLKIVDPSLGNPQTIPETPSDSEEENLARFNIGDEGPKTHSMFPEFSSSRFVPTQPVNKIYELKEGHERLGPQSAQVAALEPVQTLNSPRILAQLMNSYLLGEDREGLFIVDQHAAHERILFDMYINNYRDTRITSQPLLFPVPLKLLPSERLLMKEKGDQLRELGFIVQEEDDGHFYAASIPVLDGKSTENQVIQDLLSQVLGGWESRSLQEIKVDLLKVMACKSAVKAGDTLRETEMRSLFEQLLKTQNPYTCPHGRPTVLRLTQRQIEAGFLRT